MKVKFTVIAANVVLEAAANRPDFVVMDIKGGKSDVSTYLSSLLYRFGGHAARLHGRRSI
jgi:hypothetical protein